MMTALSMSRTTASRWVRDRCSVSNRNQHGRRRCFRSHQRRRHSTPVQIRIPSARNCYLCVRNEPSPARPPDLEIQAHPKLDQSPTLDVARPPIGRTKHGDTPLYSGSVGQVVEINPWLQACIYQLDRPTEADVELI